MEMKKKKKNCPPIHPVKVVGKRSFYATLTVTAAHLIFHTLQRNFYHGLYYYLLHNNVHYCFMIGVIYTQILDEFDDDQ